MTGSHPIIGTDPMCPGCGHRHQFQGANAAPCWWADLSEEMCTHCARCLFCNNGIQEEDAHVHVVGDLYIHAQCIRHVAPGDRVPDPARN